MTPRVSRLVSVTFLFIPALPPSQVSCDLACVTFGVCDVFVYSCPAPLPAPLSNFAFSVSISGMTLGPSS